MSPKTVITLLLGLSIMSSIFVRAELPGYPLTFGEMKVLAGYYTADGKYRGGRPEAAKKKRQGAYECLAYNAGVPGKESSSSSCMEYTVEGSIFGLGLCECQKTASSREYCSTWTCTSNSNTVSTLCRCDVESTSGLFCDSWSCTVADSDGVEGRGDYECKRASSSGHYCDAWNGKSKPEGGVHGEVAVEACECVAESNGDRVCSLWKCQEVAVEELVRDLLLVPAYGVPGLFLIAYLCFLAMTDLKLFFFALAVPGGMFLFPLAYLVVLNGGVDGATLVGIMWSIPIVLTVGFKRRINRDLEMRRTRRGEMRNDSGERSVLLTSRP